MSKIMLENLDQVARSIQAANKLEEGTPRLQILILARRSLDAIYYRERDAEIDRLFRG